MSGNVWPWLTEYWASVPCWEEGGFGIILWDLRLYRIPWLKNHYSLLYPHKFERRPFKTSGAAPLCGAGGAVHMLGPLPFFNDAFNVIGFVLCVLTDSVESDAG